jgi:hypothetical protein
MNNDNIIIKNSGLINETSPCTKPELNTHQNNFTKHNQSNNKKYYYDESDVDKFDINQYIQDRNYKIRIGDINCYSVHC